MDLKEIEAKLEDFEILMDCKIGDLPLLINRKWADDKAEALYKILMEKDRSGEKNMHTENLVSEIKESFQFMEVSAVDASKVKSQWQAHFLQIFPANMADLPWRDVSDEECFKENWKGPSEITYGTLMKEEYPNWVNVPVSSPYTRI